jgi:drug/metabolite transporter (DMT)-like permease
MAEKLARRPKVVAAALLLLATAGWGATFIVMKDALGHASVFQFLWWRFVLAGLLLVLLRPKAVLRLGWRGAGRGAALGAIVAGGYFLQTFGLRTTPAAVSGFLTGLQVVFTPLLGWLLLRHRPGARLWAATLVATSGLAVISLRGVAIAGGEVLTVVSAAVFALQVVVLGRWASSEDAYGLATVQLAVVGLASLVAAAPGGLSLPRTAPMWGAVALTAVVASAFAFAAQSWAQSHLPASTAAVLFTTEPVFAALFAWTGGEHLGAALVVGGALILSAMLLLVRAPAGGARTGDVRGPGVEGRRSGHGSDLDPATVADGVAAGV